MKRPRQSYSHVAKTAKQTRAIHEQKCAQQEQEMKQQWEASLEGMHIC